MLPWRWLLRCHCYSGLTNLGSWSCLYCEALMNQPPHPPQSQSPLLYQSSRKEGEEAHIHLDSVYLCVCVCAHMYVCVRECVCVCERERESVCVCVLCTGWVTRRWLRRSAE